MLPQNGGPDTTTGRDSFLLAYNLMGKGRFYALGSPVGILYMSTGFFVCCTWMKLDPEGPHGDCGSAEKSLEQRTKIQDPSEKGPLRISNVCEIVVVELNVVV
jgi:hypothetical protein